MYVPLILNMTTVFSILDTQKTRSDPKPHGFELRFIFKIRKYLEFTKPGLIPTHCHPYVLEQGGSLIYCLSAFLLFPSSNHDVYVDIIGIL